MQTLRVLKLFGIWAFVFGAWVLFASSLFAESLEILDKKISAADSQIAVLNKDYQKEKKANDERLRKIETKKGSAEQELRAAYASAERLNQMNLRLNQLVEQRQQLCRQWRSLYRATIDELLAAADLEKDKKKKAEIGRKLQHFQGRNSGLCLENFEGVTSQQWQSLRVENYDGPQEINQKAQLLRDISRELMIGLTRLDHRYEEALRERKTRERALEFIQEGTLFNETIAVRSNTSAQPGHIAEPLSGGPGTPGIETMFGESRGDTGGQNSSAPTLFLSDWQGSPEEFESQYKKRRGELLSEQKNLEKKIQEFEQKSKSLMIP